MAVKTLTVTLPEPVWLKLQKAAEVTYRSVDEVLSTTIDASFAALANLPTDLANELAALHLLSDEALKSTVQPSLSPAEQHRLQQLNHNAGERPLTPSEGDEQATLLQAYYQSMLRRAQALAILKQRGHDVSTLILAAI